jgi:hypothetical protein
MKAVLKNSLLPYIFNFVKAALKDLFNFIKEEVFPFRMYVCVWILIICGIVIGIEKLSYEQTVWNGPAKVIGANLTSADHVELTLVTTDGTNKKFTTEDNTIVFAYMTGTTTFQCAIAEMGSASCKAPIIKK